MTHEFLASLDPSRRSPGSSLSPPSPGAGDLGALSQQN
jgi:hypothetical protein